MSASDKGHVRVALLIVTLSACATPPPVAQPRAQPVVTPTDDDDSTPNIPAAPTHAAPAVAETVGGRAVRYVEQPMTCFRNSTVSSYGWCYDKGEDCLAAQASASAAKTHWTQCVVARQMSCFTATVLLTGTNTDFCFPSVDACETGIEMLRNKKDFSGEYRCDIVRVKG